jgi:tellurite resistance protein TerC
MDWYIVIIIVQVIFLEGVLSIDNAAILGSMVSDLPEDEKIPWPRFLKQLGHLLDPMLGHQREAALRVGLLGAYLGRALMLLLATYVIHNPWLRVVGALYLIHLAISDLGAAPDTREEMETDLGRPRKNTAFWMTVLNIEMMDLVFSLDNVVAVVALSDELWVIMLGVALGIVTMRFAASIFSKVMQKEPNLKAAAYLLVLNIGGGLLFTEITHIEINEIVRFGITIAIILLALAYGHFKFMRAFRPVLIWFSQGLGLVNAMIDWVLAPVKAILGLLFRRRSPSPARDCE